MKLFKRIYIQVFVGCLLLSQVPFLYCLYEAQRQNLNDLEKYEKQSFYNNSEAFAKRLGTMRGNIIEEEENVRDMAAVNAFRVVFGSSGALFRKGQELFNSSPYEFDYQKIVDLRKDEKLFMGGDGIEEPQDVNGRKLILFSGTYQGVKSDTYLIVYYKDVTDIYERTERLFLNGAVFSLLLLAVIGFVLYRGIYRTVRPLQELKSAASSIAKGNYDIQVPVRTKDEIGDLTVSFNQMAQKVEEHVEKLNSTNEVQRRLIGSLAHELKTPMTAIMGYSDTLLTVRLSEKWRIQALEYIRNECRRLSRLSAKMMELTGLYESEESVLLKDKSVSELLLKLKDLTLYRLEEKHIRLVTVCSPQELTARMDEDLMMSLLMNLVDNACKASSEGSVITVAADAEGISVADTGKGIPEEEISRVTEAFYMVDKSRSKSAGSIGLGLAFCEQIAQLHGATLQIESEEGMGTRVSVRWKKSE